jgi:hypothetical protein
MQKWRKCNKEMKGSKTLHNKALHYYHYLPPPSTTTMNITITIASLSA